MENLAIIGIIGIIVLAFSITLPSASITSTIYGRVSDVSVNTDYVKYNVVQFQPRNTVDEAARSGGCVSIFDSGGGLPEIDVLESECEKVGGLMDGSICRSAEFVDGTVISSNIGCGGCVIPSEEIIFIDDIHSKTVFACWSPDPGAGDTEFGMCASQNTNSCGISGSIVIKLDIQEEPEPEPPVTEPPEEPVQKFRIPIISDILDFIFNLLGLGG